MDLYYQDGKVRKIGDYAALWPLYTAGIILI